MGNRIKQFREKAGMTQNQLSELVGISRQYLSDIENQKKQPTVKVAFDCANYLGVKVDDLFFYNK